MTDVKSADADRHGLHKLKPLQVERLIKGKVAGKHPDGGRLYLVIGKTGSASWVQITQFGEMGLGTARDITLATARDLARDARALAAQGIDPKQHRDDKRAAAAAEGARRPRPFREVVDIFVPKLATTWSDTPSKDPAVIEFKNSLARYAYGAIGDIDVDELSVDDVLRVLKPIWFTRLDLADRIRRRIKQVIDYALGEAWRDENKANPAVWGGRLKKALLSNDDEDRHHPALPYAQIGEFVRALRAARATSAAAYVLEGIVLSAKRFQEIARGSWSEIDWEGRAWNIPKERMKGKKNKRRPHREPLTDPLIALLKVMWERRASAGGNDGLIFPGRRRTKALSSTAVKKLLDKLGFTDAEGAIITTHGFRSTFTDWVAECTEHADEIRKQALSHVKGDKVEQAYNRGELFERRRRLMEDWAGHVEAMAAANVVPLSRDAA